MSYMKLIKLLYLADREALLRLGHPITYDAYVSMDHGPVLSRTLNLITEEAPPDTESVWRECISAPENYTVSQLTDCGTAALSEAEIEVLDDIFKQYGLMNRWELVDHVHRLPEWVDPHGSAVPISYLDILLGAGKTEAAAVEIENELEQIGVADRLLG